MGWWKRFWGIQEEEDEEEERDEYRYICHCSICGKMQLSKLTKEERKEVDMEVECAQCKLEVRRVEALEKIARGLTKEEE